MLTRVCGFMLLALAVGAMSSPGGVGGAEKQGKAPDRVAPPDVENWDCVVNKTGKWLTVYLSSHRMCGQYTLAPDEEIRFGFNADTKKMTIVAWEYGKNNLIDIVAFDTLAQTDPNNPNCFPIVKSTPDKAGEKRERHKMTGKKEQSPSTSPVF
jgi:hypothetical protein